MIWELCYFPWLLKLTSMWGILELFPGYGSRSTLTSYIEMQMLKQLKRKITDCTHSKHLVQEMLSCPCQIILGYWPKYVGVRRVEGLGGATNTSCYLQCLNLWLCYQFMFPHSLCMVLFHSKNEGTCISSLGSASLRAGPILQGWAWLWTFLSC